jgi:hypothetical protein
LVTASTGGGRVQGHRRGDAELPHPPERAVQVLAGLGVHDQQAAARLDHGVEDPGRLVHHEVGLERDVHERAGGGDDVGTEGEVRHEVAVHDVPLDAVDAGLLQIDAGVAQVGEVRGQHGGDDLDRAEGGTGRAGR